jgi:hypothetical protein
MLVKPSRARRQKRRALGYGAYPAYGGGYYGGPRYAYGYQPYGHRHYRHHWYR